MPNVLVVPQSTSGGSPTPLSPTISVIRSPSARDVTEMVQSAVPDSAYGAPAGKAYFRALVSSSLTISPHGMAVSTLSGMSSTSRRQSMGRSAP